MFFLLADILQALVLILFDEGGVGSMKAKRKTRKQFQSLTFSGFQSSRKRVWSKTTQWNVTQWQISHGGT